MVLAKSKNKSFSEIYLKAASFCAYQERTQQEVRDKLRGENTDSDTIEAIITQLILEKYLNEERYARAYAGGKFRMKKWGRMKIEHALRGKGLSAYCINKGLEEISREDYIKTLKELIHKKAREDKEKNPYRKQHRIARYMTGKGYEPDIVWDMLRETMEDHQ